MPFNKILVPVDGSAYSQIAIDYAFWLARHLKASVSAQHVIDPRLLDLIIAPQLAETLGFHASVDASEKVFAALQTIGRTILELVEQQAQGQIEVRTHLDVGWTVEQIALRSNSYDLVVVGHRSRGPVSSSSDSMIGSVAERTVLLSSKPVLVATEPVVEVKQIAVAFDGSEPSRGALLLGEALASKTGKELKAIVVAQSGSKKDRAAAQLTAEQGVDLLRSMKGQPVFSILEGPATATILNYARLADALLIIGAYGYRTAEENMLGSTTTGVIRRARTSVLIYR